jgi:hypothetical protein
VMSCCTLVHADVNFNCKIQLVSGELHATSYLITHQPITIAMGKRVLNWAQVGLEMCAERLGSKESLGS